MSVATLGDVFETSSDRFTGVAAAVVGCPVDASVTVYEKSVQNVPPVEQSWAAVALAGADIATAEVRSREPISRRTGRSMVLILRPTSVCDPKSHQTSGTSQIPEWVAGSTIAAHNEVTGE